MTAVLLALAAAACGGAAEPRARTPRVSEAPVEVHGQARERPPETDGEIGGLSGDGYEEAFAELEQSFAGCVRRRASELDVLGGYLRLRLRVDRSGAPKWAYLAESTLGDRETERCVLDLVKARRWPRPLSGDGIAEKTLSVDPAVQPAPLRASQLGGAVWRARALSQHCRRGIKGRFTATAYVDPDGQVLAAGVAAPSEAGEDASDCIVDAVLGVRLPRLGPKIEALRKLSFAID
jgi:hypothetical protein